MRLVNDILEFADFGEPEVPEILYHYTGPEGIIGIVESSRFWATNIHFLSDIKEFEYALDGLSNWAERVQNGKGGPDPEVLEVLLDRAEQFLRVGVFVFSLSKREIF